MSNEAHDPDWYLRSPKTRKWAARCAACGVVGFRPGAPYRFFGRAPLVRHFAPVDLDEGGVCQSCAELQLSTKSASNQSSDPTLASVTPPAGQESRPR
jgi:hypothetical protein